MAPDKLRGTGRAVNIPDWVLGALRTFDPPETGKVTIELELYQGGVTKAEIGGTVRVKPPKP